MKYLIDFKPHATEQDIQSYILSISATVVKVFDRFQGTYLVDTPNVPPMSDIIEHLVADDNNHINLHSTIIVLDQSYGQNTLASDVLQIDPNLNENWWKTFSLSDVDFDASMITVDRRGSNAVVYVLDSGTNTTHPDFAGASVTNIWSYAGDVLPNNDSNGHGTAIASIVAGRSCGITNAQVRGVKIFDQNIPTRQSDMIDALNAIFNDYTNNFSNSENMGAIVNCSWTIDKNPLIESKIQHMINSGMLFVCAAGNSGMPIDNTTPASMADVLTVGAYNSDFQPCSFSNYTGTSATVLTQGDTNHGALDGWAPGQDIYVAIPGGGYGNASGTSMAAGVLSAVLAYNLSWHLPEFRTAMPSNFFMTSGSLSRRGLLNLSDPKYAQSVNRIATFFYRIAPSQTYSVFSRAVEGNPRILNMFSPHYVEKIEYDVELPDGLKISNTGRLYGIAPLIVDSYIDYQHTVIPLRVSFRNGSVQNYDLEIFTYRNGLVPSELAQDDPVLNLKLQAGSCTQGDCELDGCFDDCAEIEPCQTFPAPGCGSKIQCNCPSG